MNQMNQHISIPKEKDFNLAPTQESQKFSVLPAVAELGVDLDYKGVVRVGGGVFDI
jgi:hypothetical protein